MGEQLATGPSNNVRDARGAGRHAYVVIDRRRLDVYGRHMTERQKPGSVRDAIIAAFQREHRQLTVAEVYAAVSKVLDGDVPSSSVRSYLNNNTPGQFIRTARGTYRLVRR
jgi:site-specific DNA-methyltransferase (adenine-specific)